MCQLLVGLPTVTVLGVVDALPELPMVVHIETASDEVEHCSACGSRAGIMRSTPPITSVDSG